MRLAFEAMATLVEPATEVPFFSLRPMHEVVRDALLEDVAALFDSGAFTNGPQVAQFERVFSEYVGTRHCIGVASGLDALRLGLIASGLEPGGEVIVPAATFAATFEAVTQAGGVPVVVDVLDGTYDIDPGAVYGALSSRTHTVMPVHLYGQMVDMRVLLQIADAHGVRVIEDACQAHGATRDGMTAGAGGFAAAFSFYPAKNLGAMGDAGALVTNDDALPAVVRALREHGQHAKYEHALEGWTARLDTLQALVLLHKLPLVDRWNDERRAVAALYAAGLDGVGDLRLPAVAPGSNPVWHLYVVRTADPAALAEDLRRRGIATARHYPQPPHLSGAYAHLGYAPGTFPVAEALSREALSLPLYPGMSQGQVEQVVDAVCASFAGA